MSARVQLLAVRVCWCAGLLCSNRFPAAHAHDEQHRRHVVLQRKLLQGTMPGALQALRLSDCLHSVTITESNRSGRAVAIIDLVPFGGPCSDQADGMQAWR